MVMRKIFYFVYYIKETDWKKFIGFLEYVSEGSAKRKVTIFFDALTATFKYDVSLLDYFYFKFYEKDSVERNKWAGTGFMYEYQLRMNPKNTRDILENKIAFLGAYGAFVKHPHASISDVDSNSTKAKEVLFNDSKKIVFKDSRGQCGLGIAIKNSDEVSKDTLSVYMKENKFDMIESFVVQHDDLMALSPSGLNTIRIFTQLDANDKVVILGCRLRITINSQVDNLASGNIAAPIDVKTGIVIGMGVFSDIRKNDCSEHPVTKVQIVGFQVPFWEDTLEMIHKSALLDTRNRSIGWDVAITNNGPELIEGNHNWCKLLWQLPVKKGLKAELHKF